MKHSKPKALRFQRLLTIPLIVGGFFVFSGCKNTTGGTGSIWPIGAPAGGDPLMGPPPAVLPASGLSPTGLAPVGPIASPTGPMAGPLPAMHSPNTLGSPAALATGTTSMLSNPRDPLAGNTTTVPALSAPIPTNGSNAPYLPNSGINPGGSLPVLLNPVATSPMGNPNGGNPPPVGASIPTGPTPIGGSAVPPPPDPVPGGSVSKLNPTGPIALAGLQTTNNSQFNLAVQSNLTQLQDQLRQQGQTVDQATQTALTQLNVSLCQNGMVWQKMQRQANGTWKSIASFSDPKNPANRRTMEAVAATPDAALGALLGEVQAAR